MASECRFYEKVLPDVDDLVMVKVDRVAEMGAYVSLLEYNRQEGMILLSELSKRRIRSISKLVKLNSNAVCSVMRVDKDKGYIDLSKRKVSMLEINACEKFYSEAKQVHHIMRQLHEKHPELSMLEWCSKVSWPLDKKYKTCYTAFKKFAHDGDDIWADIDLPDELKQAASEVVSKKMTSAAIKLSAIVEVSCIEYEGINAVKDALIAGLKASTSACPLSIKLIAPPKYEVTTTTTELDEGRMQIDAALDLIRDVILEKKGKFVIKEKPEVINLESVDKNDTTAQSDDDSSDEDEDEDAESP